MRQNLLQLAPKVSEWAPPAELPSLSGVKRLSLDTETNGRNSFNNTAVGISLAYRDNHDVRRYYLPFGHSEGNLDRETVLRWARTELRDKDVVFANAKFDIHMLRNTGVDLEAIGVRPHDVAFSAALLDDNRRAGLDLDTLGRQYTGYGKRPFDGDMNHIADYHSSEVGPYAEWDAELTLRVDEGTLPLIAKDGLDRVLKLENEIIYFVCEIERNGCRLDVAKLEQWRKEIRSEFEQRIMSIHKQTGMLVSPGSGEDVRRLLKFLDLPLPKRDPKKHKPWQQPKKEGTPSYTAEELSGYLHPVMDDVVQARQLEGLLSKFLDKWHEGLNGGDVLRSQYHQLKFTGDGNDESFGAVSGRFSSSGGGKSSDGYSFNAQQTIKPELQAQTLGDHHIIRELIIPDEGQEYGASDASQIEYRLFAHFTNAPRIVKAYTEDADADFHGLVHEMLKVHRPTITRSTTKNVNFGKLYRAGPQQLAATARISVKDAEQLYRDLEKIFPEADRLSNRIEHEAEKKGFVTTIMGRRARLTERFHSATNRVIQGSAADLMKLKMARIYRERKTIGITKLRQTIHDEQCFDIDPDPKYKELVAECFNVQEIPLRVPITWKTKYGKNWRDCK